MFDWAAYRVVTLALGDDPADVTAAELVRPAGWVDVWRTELSSQSLPNCRGMDLAV